MSNRDERLEDVLTLINDPELDLTLKEAFSYTINYCMYEIALMRRNRAQASIKKYANRLNDADKIYQLRKKMKDL
jgi:hypothetical protein